MWILAFAVGVVCGMPIGAAILYVFAAVVDPSCEGDAIDKGNAQ